MDGDHDQMLSDETWGAGGASPIDLAEARASLERTRERFKALAPTTALARAFAAPPEAVEQLWAGGGSGAPEAPRADAPKHPLSDSLEEDDVLADVLGPAAEPGGGAFHQLPPAYCIREQKCTKC